MTERALRLAFLGDVMLGRGVDQVLPTPSSPEIYEHYLTDARDYVELAEGVNGPIPKPVSLSYPWGDALAELVVHALRMVDEDSHPLGAGELEREDLDSGQAALDSRGDLAVKAPLLVVQIRHCPLKKNGRGAPISNCLKCGGSRIARRRPLARLPLASQRLGYRVSKSAER